MRRFPRGLCRPAGLALLLVAPLAVLGPNLRDARRAASRAAIT